MPSATNLTSLCEDSKMTEPRQVIGKSSLGAKKTFSKAFITDPIGSSGVGRIFDKLGVRDRPAAIVFAFDRGVVHVQP